MIRLARTFLQRDFLIATSYKLSFAFQMLRIAAVVPICFYLGRLVPDTSVGGLGPAGDNYFAFVLIGIGFLDYLAVSLHIFEQSLRESQLMGTLELVLLSPTRLSSILLCSSLWVYLLATIRFVLYLVVGALFGLELGQANLPAAMLILFLSIFGFAGFGILSASVTVVVKRGLGLNAIMSMLSLVCGGVLFPTRALPEWVSGVSAFIPMTHALEGMRLALFRNYGIADLWPQIAMLGIFAVALLPLGLFSFNRAVHRTKMTGTLSQY